MRDSARQSRGNAPITRATERVPLATTDEGATSGDGGRPFIMWAGFAAHSAA
jgi:hypothetical protein